MESLLEKDDSRIDPLIGPRANCWADRLVVPLETVVIFRAVLRAELRHDW